MFDRHHTRVLLNRHGYTEFIPGGRQHFVSHVLTQSGGHAPCMSGKTLDTVFAVYLPNCEGELALPSRPHLPRSRHPGPVGPLRECPLPLNNNSSYIWLALPMTVLTCTIPSTGRKRNTCLENYILRKCLLKTSADLL